MILSVSDTGKSEFTLGEYTDRDQLVAAVRGLEYVGGNTNTSGGLRVMMTQQFSVANGDRPNVQDIAIVITDGESTFDKNRTISDAETAHTAGIKVGRNGISS